MVFFSPLAYPGYDPMSMAVSDLSAIGAPSRELANRLNALFGPCGLISIMALCVVIGESKIKSLRTGIYLFSLMEWICIVGYTMFPLNILSDGIGNTMHLVVTGLVVVLSVISILLIIAGAKKANLNSLSIWGMACFVAMLMGPIGTGLMPKEVFGIFERFSTFSAVVFNAVLGVYLYKEKFKGEKEC
ncbi:MAG: DUF998 domain-containing protein [Erysipelotrichaceae bacterium]|nr:DUF998 domain-containing protein [Erysipelotrichaceae bacterium]